MVLCKNILLGDLLGSQHLFEILQTPLTFQNSENVVKKGCFEKTFPMESVNLFSNDRGI